MESRSEPSAGLEQIVRFAANVRFDDIPRAVIDRTKAMLLDTVAVMLAGSSAPGIDPLVQEFIEWGGVGESTIAGYAGKIPAPNAAFVNAAMVHALDYDDAHDDAQLHANVCVVPAVLALAEAKRISGRELLVAQVVGLEIACRLSLAGQPGMNPGWLPTTVFGCFGAALSAARVYALLPEQMRHAMGIAYSHAGGNRQGLLDGALSKRIQPGIYAKAGVVSASLAKRGITGARHILDGFYGLYPLFVGPNVDLSDLTKDLGGRFELMNIGLKAYPCCRATHRPIDGALALAKEGDWAPNRIAKVRVSLSSEIEYQLVGAPLLFGENIQVNAQFSVQYAVACALLRRRVSIDDFGEARILEPDVLDLARRVDVALDTAKDVSVTVELADGQTFRKSVGHVSGHARNPLSADQRLHKVADCLAHARVPQGDGAAARLAHSVEQLDQMNEVSSLIASFGGVPIT